MLQKGAIVKVEPIQGQFLSPLFLVPKKDQTQRPVINLKKLNAYIPYNHFKMEGLFLLKEILQEGDYMCKLDLRDAYFSVPLHKDSQKFVRFPWKGSLYQFQCLCFGLSPAPRIFSKLMKVPVALIRKLGGRIIVFLDDILLIAPSIEELVVLRDTVIFLLQNLGFLINIKKSVFIPNQVIEFLGMLIDSRAMSLSLPTEKVEKIKIRCRDILGRHSVSLREISSLIGSMSSSAVAVLPAPLQYRSVQRQQIFELKKQRSFNSMIQLNAEARAEISWWLNNLDLYNGRCLISPPPQLVIQTDASKKGWGAVCRNQKAGGLWSKEEQQEHINVLELRAARIALLTYIPMFRVTSVHMQMDNIVALTYLLKMGGTKSLDLLTESKEIWGFLLSNRITLTAEYLPGILNVEADRESRLRDSSEWKMNPKIFQRICKIRGTPDMDLFASRISCQVPSYFSWRIDPYSKGQDAFQQNWKYLNGYAFPPFALIGRVLRKLESEQARVLLITPAWQSQAWYPKALQLSIQNPILLPQDQNMLKDPSGMIHPLVQNQTLHLIVWTLSGNVFLQRAYQRKLPVLSCNLSEKELFLITNRPGDSGLAGVVKGKLVPLDVL